MTWACSDDSATPADTLRGNDLAVNADSASSGDAGSAAEAGVDLARRKAAADGPVAGADCVPEGNVLEVGPGKTFATIAAALAQASAQATILVADGLYEESLTVESGGAWPDERLLLFAAHSRGATIRASGRVLRLLAPISAQPAPAHPRLIGCWLQDQDACAASAARGSAAGGLEPVFAARGSPPR